MMDRQNSFELCHYSHSDYTVSDNIKTTYGFDLGAYLVILAIFSQYFTKSIAHILTDKGLSFVNWYDLSIIISFY
jgi:hypothetical protein